jgi:MarR family transcriptional regulator, transcriptional regulator for hemolysin
VYRSQANNSHATDASTLVARSVRLSPRSADPALASAGRCRARTYGLSQATWRPLVHLASFKTSPRQCELAEQLQIGCPALVRLLDNLEEKGLIERALVDGDRRAHHIQLTREGRRLATQVYEIILDIERRLLSEVSAADLDRCTRVLAAIENQLDTPVEAQPRKKRRAS